MKSKRPEADLQSNNHPRIVIGNLEFFKMMVGKEANEDLLRPIDEGEYAKLTASTESDTVRKFKLDAAGIEKVNAAAAELKAAQEKVSALAKMQEESRQQLDTALYADDAELATRLMKSTEQDRLKIECKINRVTLKTKIIIDNCEDINGARCVFSNLLNEMPKITESRGGRYSTSKIFITINCAQRDLLLKKLDLESNQHLHLRMAPCRDY